VTSGGVTTRREARAGVVPRERSRNAGSRKGRGSRLFRVSSTSSWRADGYFFSFRALERRRRTDARLILLPALGSLLATR
jgi:hypothetical protein